jgi:RimJ/RimL family protein N-acetyltransferase
MHESADSLLPRRFAGGCLRRLHASDLGPFQAYRNIPDLGRYQGWAAMSEAEALAFLVGMEVTPLFQPGTWVQLGIADSDTGGLVGDIGILLQADTQTAEVGFTLAPSAQGRGVATLAVREALQMLFTATSVWQVLGITDARNSRSIRLLERLGFKCRASRRAVFRGEECTELVFVLPRATANQGAAADNHPPRHVP